MKDSEVFAKARPVMLERGMAKEMIVALDGRVCLNGACNIARWGQADVMYTDASSNYLYNRQLGNAAHDLTGWTGHGDGFNDAPDTTLNDCLDVLERAEKLALIEEGEG